IDVLMFAAAVAGAAAGLLTSSGSVPVVSVATKTWSHIDGTVWAAGNVLVRAEDEVDIDLFAGAGALSIKGNAAAVGLSLVFVVIANDTQAWIASTAIVDALGDSSTSISVFDGRTLQGVPLRDPLAQISRQALLDSGLGITEAELDAAIPPQTEFTRKELLDAGVVTAAELDATFPITRGALVAVGLLTPEQLLEVFPDGDDSTPVTRQAVIESGYATAEHVDGEFMITRTQLIASGLTTDAELKKMFTIRRQQVIDAGLATAAELDDVFPVSRQGLLRHGRLTASQFDTAFPITRDDLTGTGLVTDADLNGLPVKRAVVIGSGGIAEATFDNAFTLTHQQLVDAGLMTEQMLNAALEASRSDLITKGLVTDAELTDAGLTGTSFTWQQLLNSGLVTSAELHTAYPTVTRGQLIAKNLATADELDAEFPVTRQQLIDLGLMTQGQLDTVSPFTRQLIIDSGLVTSTRLDAFLPVTGSELVLMGLLTAEELAGGFPRKPLHGVAVEALSTDDVFILAAAALQPGSLVGISGAVGMVLVAKDTLAFIAGGAQVNTHPGDGTPNAQQSVSVAAASETVNFLIPINIFSGVISLGAALTLTRVDNDTQASIRAGAVVHAARDIEVRALSRIEGDAFLANLGKSVLLGIHATIAMYSIRGDFTGTFTVPLTDLLASDEIGALDEPIDVFELLGMDPLNADTVAGMIDELIASILDPSGDSLGALAGQVGEYVPALEDVAGIFEPGVPSAGYAMSDDELETLRVELGLTEAEFQAELDAIPIRREYLIGTGLVSESEIDSTFPISRADLVASSLVTEQDLTDAGLTGTSFTRKQLLDATVEGASIVTAGELDATFPISRAALLSQGLITREELDTYFPITRQDVVNAGIVTEAELDAMFPLSTGVIAEVAGATLLAGHDVVVAARERTQLALDTTTALDLLYKIFNPTEKSEATLADVVSDRALVDARSQVYARVTAGSAVTASNDIVVEASVENDHNACASTGSLKMRSEIVASVDASTLDATRDASVRAVEDVFSTNFSILPRFDGLRMKSGTNDISNTVHAIVLNSTITTDSGDITVEAVDDIVALNVGAAITL
ncbi:MAG TPA: hypothetical protein VLS51_12050, partial [Propionibacteriaceae bacterium]|nr:hypothetical protein [Propionibacteriaceae bacterium]